MTARMHHKGLLGIAGDPTRPDGLVFTDRHGRPLKPAATPTPPERPPPQAAAEAGVTYSEWRPSPNDPLDVHWVTWNWGITHITRESQVQRARRSQKGRCSRTGPGLL